MSQTGKKVLLTGCTGFVGSKLAEELLAYGHKIFSLERITNRPNRLGCLTHSITHLYHDFQSPIPTRILDKLEGVEWVIHCGAEVHGLRSLENPELFVKSNVLGTLNLLEASRVLKPTKFLYISTAEAVGSCEKGSLDENAPLRPSNPYSAAKAAGEMLCRSYHDSFGVPSIVVRTMNVFGEGQDISKFVPMIIKKLLRGEPIQIHVGDNGKAGSRHWLHVRELVKGINWLLHCGQVGETYHVVGPEKNNLEIYFHIRHILEHFGGLATGTEMTTVRPGTSHDMRYSIVDTKILPNVYKSDVGTLGTDLATTARQYQDNQEWLQ